MKKAIGFFIIILFFKSNLLALSVIVGGSNASFSAASTAQSNPVVTAVGSSIRYTLLAEIAGANGGANENWGCTEIDINGKIKAYDHDDWQSGSHRIDRTEKSLAPSAAGTYGANFTFFNGGANGGRCSGARVGGYYAPNAFTVMASAVGVTQATFSGENGAFSKSVTLQVGSTLRYRLSATVSNLLSSENWGCTEVKISNIKRYNDHANWGVGTLTRTINSVGDGLNALANGAALKAPSSAGTYSVTFQFFSGNGKNGGCEGDLIGEYVAVNAVKTIGSISFRPTFDMYYRKSLIGDMKAIGSSAMCIPDEKERGLDSIGVCQDPQFRTIIENMNLKYAYVNQNGAVVAHPTTSRTGAFLDLPPNAKIVYAKLYWLGRLSSDYGSQKGAAVNCPNPSSVSDSKVLNALSEGADRVKLELPSGVAGYVKAQRVYLETYDANCAYLAQADVTNILDKDNAEGTYFVSEIKSRRNGSPVGTFGGWTLVTVYENPSDTTHTYRLVTLFDGWRGGSGTIYTLISGFLTPSSGVVKSALFVMGADGDSDSGDRMCINALNAWCNTGESYRSGVGGQGAERLIYPYKNYNTPIPHKAFDGFRNNYYENAFLSTVSEGAVGLSAAPIGQQPQFSDDYILGFDLHTYYMEDFLGNSATQTNIVVEPRGDYVIFGALGFSTVVYNPRIADIKIGSTVSHRPDAALMCDGKKDMRGATINFAYTLENSGQEPASGITIYTDFAETGLDKYIESVTAAFVTGEGPVIYRVGACSTSLSGIACFVDFMDISRPNAASRATIRYNVKLKNDFPLLADDFDLEVKAHANYSNAVTGEKVAIEAINLTPAIAGRLCANESCKTLAKRGAPNGYHMIDPDWGYDIQPFEVYCDNMSKSDYLNAKTYLPLVMTTDFSNLLYKTIKNGDYYHKSNQADKTQYKAIRINDDLSVNPDDDIIKNGFSNLNLVGTPFAIDYNKTAIVGCGAPKKAHFDQIVKIDLEFDKTNRVCKAQNDAIQLKQVSGVGFGKYQFDKVANYKDAKFANGFSADALNPSENSPYAYKSCLAIRNEVKGAPNGFYYINPKDNRDTGLELFAKDPDKHRPFVVFCDMNGLATENRESPSILLALDSDITASAEDLIGRDSDTCSKLGMYMFVPINKPTFNKTRNYLKAIKPEWSSYTGSVKYNLSQLWASSGSVGMGNDEYRLFWPYGSFGVFNEKAGAGENTNKLADGGSIGAGFPLNSLSGLGLSQNGEWQTIFKYMPESLFDEDDFPKEEKDSWWISDKGCNALKNLGYADGWELCSSGVAYDENGCYLNGGGAPEPNGDYAAKQWLYYIADNEGDIYACNDKKAPNQAGWKTLGGAEATYIYAHYTCMTLDSFAKSKGLNPLPEDFSGWDATLDINNEPAALYTKMANQPFAVQIAPLGEINSFEGQLCAALAYGDQGVYGETPTGAKIGLTHIPAANFTKGYTSGGIEYACVRIDPKIDLTATPISFIWEQGAQKASRDANITLLAYDCSDFSNIESCESKSYGGGRFSVRPSFKVAPDYSATLISGVDYPTEAPLPNGGFVLSATRGYTQPSEPVPCDGENGLCVLAADKKPVEYGVLDANITFEDGVARIHRLSYDDVGEIALKFVDKEWTKIDIDRDYGGSFTAMPKYKNDCIPDSYASAINNDANPQNSPHYGKIGCLVGGENNGDLPEVALKIIPDRFRINDFEVAGVFEDPYAPSGGGRSSFAYYANETDDHYAAAVINAEAINKKGAVTRNYGEGNYSKDAEYGFDFPSSALRSDDMPDKVQRRFWRRVVEKNGKLSADARIRADMWRLGGANLRIGFNFGREFSNALPVFFMRAGTPSAGYDFNFSITDEDGARGAANWDKAISEFSEINFVYGRAFASDALSRGADANVSFLIDYFSDRGSNGIRSAYNAPSLLASNAGWFRLTGRADSRTEANVTANINGYPERGSAPILNNETRTTFAYPIDQRRPRRFVAHLGMPAYLWYHPFGKPYADVRTGEEETRRGCFEHPCGTIEFESPQIEGWGGSGVRDDKRYYDDNSTRERTPLRLGR
ncbi:MAG: hypothetical protein LBC09_05375 [Helicobacteraceae bacterium]|jgi:hypothetical protein|nr:hypothetical protein [Helicobacteraceae bacterium]